MGRGPCLKKTSCLWLAITLTHVNKFGYFFGRNVTDKVSSQKMLYYATSNNLCFCTTYWNEETWKLHFHSNAVLVHCRIQLVAVWFLTHAAVWLPKSCNRCVQFGAVGGMIQKKGSWEHCSGWTVLHAQCTSALSSGFPLLQGNEEALDGWGQKTKHRLISYFLSNTSAKNYRIWFVCVKIMASWRWDVFWDNSIWQWFKAQSMKEQYFFHSAWDSA